MKKILLIALSTVSLGGTLFAFFRKNRIQKAENQTPLHTASDRGEQERRERKTTTKPMGMAVKRDGSLDVRSHERKRAVKQSETAPAVHLKKDGSPDKRFRENR